ncbi:uncharacterized protein JCM15063_001773 [Sporobolomyces koalae]|uniref:uncharacterized protein n=1 Tax=Sporobolomyces koalae TaxID=500713 RepID=UPI0031729032
MRVGTLWLAVASVLSTAAAAATIPQIPFEMTPAVTGPRLSDLLTKSRHSRLFYDYVRESTSISTRLANPLEQTTVFAPIDAAIVSLARRPHQGPAEPVEGHVRGYAGSREDEEARADYLEQWIGRHLVAERVDLAREGTDYATLHKGASVSFVKGDTTGQYRVMPGNLEVVEIEQASNGIILFLKGTLSLDNVE